MVGRYYRWLDSCCDPLFWPPDDHSQFNLKMPGCEEATMETTAGGGTGLIDDLPHNILAACGGQQNIKHLDACITRLRIEVNEKSNVNKDRLKQLGAFGVLEVGNNVQAIFGTRSDTIKSQMQDIIAGRTPVPNPATDVKPMPKEEKAQGEQGERIIAEEIVMPVNGELLDITNVPDPVFAEKMTGDGFAILPHDGTISSPVYGKVFNVFPSKHAVAIMSNGGKEVLVHIGVNTVKLKGLGLNVLVQEGDLVSAGQPIIEVDLEYVKANAPSIISPVIFTNLPVGSTVTLKKSGVLKIGDQPIIEIK